MALTGRDIIFIIECIFYAPASILSLFLCIRHCCRGQRAQIAWIFLYMYCHIRVAEAALGLAAISSSDLAVYSTSILFSVIGVPTLLLTTMGLLERVYINLSKTYPTRVKPWVYGLLQVPFEAAIGICAKGASNSTADQSNNGIYTPQTWTKVGLMLCVVGYAIIVGLTAAMLRRQSHAEPDEQRSLRTVVRSLPFLFIRLIYTILVTFLDRNVFKSYDGNVIVVGLMAVLPEMIVVIIYMVEGFRLERLPKDKRDKKSKSKCRRKRTGWPSGVTEDPVLLDDNASASQPNSEAQAWKDIDDGGSGISRV
jgi:protein-S-isoprenylcysteine O-methyltransferase Ste14